MPDHTTLHLDAPPILRAGQLFLLTLRLDAPAEQSLMLQLTCSHPDLFAPHGVTWPRLLFLTGGLDRLVLPLTVHPRSPLHEPVEVTFTVWETGYDLFDPEHGRLTTTVQITP